MRARNRNLFLPLALLALLTTGCASTAKWPAINEGQPSDRTPGRWVWAELFTEDVAAAKRFYADVFGWEMQDHGRDGDSYTLIRAQGRRIAGIVHHPSTKNTDRSAQWLGLMSVDDIAGATAKASAGGGEVVLAARRLEGRGEVAVLSDPEGALFGLIHSDSGDPPDLFPSANSWLWRELWAEDVPKMSDFYRDIGPYEIRQAPAGKAFGDDRAEVYLAAQDYPRAGIVEQRRDDLPSAWLPYLRVTDLQATLERVERAGGNIVVHPDPEIRGGRVAIFTDPLGAPVGVATWPAEVAERSER